MEYQEYFFTLRKKCYPFGSTEGYEADEKAYGDRDALGRQGFRAGFIFWYGQLTHFLTGLLPSLLLSAWSPFIAPAFFLGYVFAKEWFFDRRNLNLSTLQHKEIIDIGAHVVGAICGGIPYF